MLENFSLKLKNYKLSAEQQFFVKCEMESLSQKIPYNATVRLVLSYNNKMLEGKLAIISGRRSFYSSAQSATLKSLTNSLSRKIRSQVKKWKRKRSYKEITSIKELSASVNFNKEYDKTFRKVS